VNLSTREMRAKAQGYADQVLEVLFAMVQNPKLTDGKSAKPLRSRRDYLQPPILKRAGRVFAAFICSHPILKRRGHSCSKQRERENATGQES
jgi:hypothetical protein